MSAKQAKNHHFCFVLLHIHMIAKKSHFLAMVFFSEGFESY